MLCFTGSVKKAVGVLGIIHDRSKFVGVMDDFRSAISHTKESKASFNPATHNLNPARVFSLFKRMVDEVILIKKLKNNENGAWLYILLHSVPLEAYLYFLLLLQDCELLYLSDRPENLIMTNIAVPPIPIRPSVIVDGSQRSSQYFIY